MHLVRQNLDVARRELRKYPRCNLQCRAKIVIGNRHYAGYIHNMSRAGAKLRTITLMRRLGTVILTLPDLLPMRCHLRWNDGYNAGVEFAQPLSQREFSNWAEARMQMRQFSAVAPQLVADLAEPTEVLRIGAR